ncbi:PAS/PAC sensor hybrid histidine kinase [Caballeronia fortuita]|uniref:histidine kinase n=1 Tax=Caballeronia fortuita TaxID=1777138 RepID=A0A158CMI8_9BURK|nr:histidine kinase dimerization/phospho-acceptor domain-containing protein [Caballeronia fortuita]SAK83575.1 PAS/PAC sensor hybrid histidine kinase [Caballeronia fortuita]
MTHSRAIPIKDASGRVVEWFGTASDATQRRLAEEAVAASEARYLTLFESIDEGYCIIRAILDDAGQGYDYVFEEVNRSFERQTGLSGVEDRSRRSLAPEREAHRYEVYGRIAVTGESQQFEQPAAALHRWYDVYAFRIGEPRDRRVAVWFHDMSDRKRAEMALTEADRWKDEFLATLADVLRNPLAPIRTGLDVLKLNGEDPTTTSNVVQMIERQVTHMVHLVDDLLEVSRISRGTIVLRKQRVDLGAVLHSAVEISRPLIDAGHHRLSLELPGQALFVNGDPVRLAQVIANLLNHAAKYTAPGGYMN